MPWWLVLRGSFRSCGCLPCCWHCVRSSGGQVPWWLEQRGSRHHRQDWVLSGSTLRCPPSGVHSPPVPALCHCSMERQRLYVDSPPSRSPTRGRWNLVTSYCISFLLFSFCACSPCFFLFSCLSYFYISCPALLFINPPLALFLDSFIIFPLFFRFCVPILANPLLALCLVPFFIVPLFFCFCEPFCPAVQG